MVWHKFSIVINTAKIKRIWTGYLRIQTIGESVEFSSTVRIYEKGNENVIQRSAPAINPSDKRYLDN